MVTTFTVMAAGMMLGQAPVLPSTGQSPAPKEYIYSGGVLVPVGEAQKPAISGQLEENKTPVLTWIKGLFKRGDDAPPHIIGGNAPAKTNDNAVMPPAEISAPPTAFPQKPATTSYFTPRNEVLVIQQNGTTEAPKVDAPKNAATIEIPMVQTPKAAAPKVEIVSKVAFTPAAGASSPILPINANRIGRDEKFEWVTGQLQIEKDHFILYYATPETVDPHHGRIQLNPQKVDMRQFQNGDLVSMRGHLSHGASPVYQLTSADLIERAKR